MIRYRTWHGAAVCLLFALAGCSGGDGGDGEATADDGPEPPPGDGIAFGDATGDDEVELPSADGIAFGGGDPDEDDADIAAPVIDEPRAPAFVERTDLRGTDTAYAYRPGGPWADVLADCARAERVADSCTLDTLPFIAQRTERPTVDEVMERLVVTHDWMGVRFEQMLRAAPDGLLQLFAPTTSILIGSEVRPSFYTGLTGGIQLDADYLWLTVAEKANVSIDEDYRTDFGNGLAFRELFTWWRDGDFAYEYFPLDDDTERTLEQASGPLMRLLFHELAHANDFLPPGSARLLDSSLVPSAALDANSEQWLSPRLQDRFPIAQPELEGLAGVLYRGREPTPEQASATADYVGALFEAGGGATFYAYHTINEDFAVLFDAAMMKALYGIDRHVGFTGQPADPDDFDCGDLLVGWGQRERLGDPSVVPRVGWVIEAIYGQSDALGEFLTAQEGTQEPMAVGESYCDELDASPALATRARRGLPTERSRELPDAVRHAVQLERQGRVH